MSVIFGPDLFVVASDIDIAAYPDGGPFDYAYNRGSASDCTVNAANDRAECTVTNSEVLVRIIDNTISAEMATQEVSANILANNDVGGDTECGLAVRYTSGTRGYVGQIRPFSANEVVLDEDDGGYTFLASADRGLVNNTLYAASLRAVGYSDGTRLTLIIGGTQALVHYDTTASALGAPGFHMFEGLSTDQASLDNLLVEDLSGYPLVLDSAITNGTGATTSATVNLPTSGIRAGETLLCLIRNAAGGTITFPNEGTDWTQMFEDSSDGSNDTMALAWRKADGTEGATITVSFGTSGKFAAITYRIINAADPTTRAPEFATLVTGTSTTPDPGTVTPTGGSKKYLFIWMGGWEGEQTSPPASFPTNYNSPVGADSGAAGPVAGNCRVATAHREAETSSEDPGSWTIDVSDDWTATVVAIHPIGASEFMPAVGELNHTGGWIGGGDV